MYPNPSDWNNGSPNSAWIVRSGHICQTTGWNFLLGLQTQLRYRLSAAALPSYDGSLIHGDDVPVNDPTGASVGWTSSLLKGLYAIAQNDGAPQEYLASIQGDALVNNVSAMTLAAAAWISDFSTGYAADGSAVYGQGSPNDIQIPVGTSLPQFGITPPASPYVLGMDCNLVGTAAVIPVGSGNIIPFAANGWVILGMLAFGAIVSGVLVKNVPVKKSKRSR